jgi:hypothetical protein
MFSIVKWRRREKADKILIADHAGRHGVRGRSAVVDCIRGDGRIPSSRVTLRSKDRNPCTCEKVQNYSIRQEKRLPHTIEYIHARGSSVSGEGFCFIVILISGEMYPIPIESFDVRVAVIDDSGHILSTKRRQECNEQPQHCIERL